MATHEMTPFHSGPELQPRNPHAANRDPTSSHAKTQKLTEEIVAVPSENSPAASARGILDAVQTSPIGATEAPRHAHIARVRTLMCLYTLH